MQACLPRVGDSHVLTPATTRAPLVMQVCLICASGSRGLLEAGLAIHPRPALSAIRLLQGPRVCQYRSAAL